MATQQLMTVESVSPVEYTTEQIATLKKTVAHGTSDAEFSLFLEVCKSSGLNPFAKQIYAIRRGDKMTIQTGIDGYRVLAERTGKYAGQVGPFWCGDDGQWHDVWLSAAAPVACKIGVLRRDFNEPMWAVARTAAYAQASNGLWKTMPDVMIAKCAEALALRKAFPEHISGVYTAEEMEQADNAPTAYVEATSATAQPHTGASTMTPAQKPAAWNAMTDSDVLKALNSLGVRGQDASYAYLKKLRAEMKSQGLVWTPETVGTQLMDRIRQANEAADLSTLDTGSIGA